MNTPEPCCHCGFLYYDCMTEDDTSSGIECMKHLTMGLKNCEGFKKYDSMTKEDQKLKWGF